MTVKFKSLLSKKAKFRSLNPDDRNKAEVEDVWPLLLALAADDVVAFKKELDTYDMQCSYMVFQCDAWEDGWHDLLTLANMAESWQCLMALVIFFSREEATDRVVGALNNARIALDFPNAQTPAYLGKAVSAIYCGILKNHILLGDAAMLPYVSRHFPKSTKLMCDIFNLDIESWAKEEEEVSRLLSHWKRMVAAIQIDDAPRFSTGLLSLARDLRLSGRDPRGWFGGDAIVFMGKALTTFGSYKCHEKFWLFMNAKLKQEEARTGTAMAYAVSIANEQIDDSSPNSAKLGQAVEGVFNSLFSNVGREGRAMVRDYAANDAWTERIVVKAISKAEADETKADLEECTVDPNTNSIGTRAPSRMRI